MSKRHIFADIETHNAGRQYGMTPREFFRLGQWAVNDGPVNITTDYDEFMAILETADYLVFHNGIGFDLSVLYGVDSGASLNEIRRTMGTDYRVVKKWFPGREEWPVGGGGDAYTIRQVNQDLQRMDDYGIMSTRRGKN